MSSENVFILGGNGTYANRGCEAIVRGTVKILRHHFDSPRFVACSAFRDGELTKQREAESDPDIAHEAMSRCQRFDRAWIITNIAKRVRPSWVKFWYYKSLLPYIESAKAVLAVGGDNYSLDYGKKTLSLCLALDNLALHYNKPIVIWGASVGPFTADRYCEKYMAKHLRDVQVFAREPLTETYLRDLGLTDNVHRVADPAFLLEPAKPSAERLAVVLHEGGIGINLSPLMVKFASGGNQEAWLEQSVRIVQSILRRTKREVYLIPHVSGAHYTQQDHRFLTSVRNRLQESEKTRVHVIPDNLSAAEVKWVIGQMAFFAGARTHSTIAALSSLVPTLSFGYSVKSRGINLDAYGHTDYCLDVRNLDPERVGDLAKTMLTDANHIVSHLKESIPRFQAMALNAGAILRNLLE